VSEEAASRCAACGAELRERQRWCLRCGAAMMTRVAPARRWASVGAGATLVALLALVGIGYALATLLSS
jgi:predicted RNA-binding Zn-ribbon protein involved in translation (DUF1610 family)